MKLHPKQAGFTLVELLIVVVILGILAAVVIPQFNNAAAESKESALASNLATIRQSIELYKVQHSDAFPGSTMTDQLTKKTDVDGTVNATSGKFGPYLRNGFPKNPVNSKATVKVAAITGTTAPSDLNGWLYDSSSGEFRCDSKGSGPSGATYFSL